MALEGVQLGHYRLVRLIGSGGMGEVYFAEDSRIARKVAIKVVRNEADPYPNAAATKEATRLFEREMKAIATLDHPNILPLIDFGEETVNKATLTYMVMPFRSEGSLVDWLQKQGNGEILSPHDVNYIVRQAADALQHAHNRNLMHLDVKPSNFLIRPRDDHPGLPDVLLADFGIAKFNSATATASQSIRGTPAYMAPEQWAGSPVAATDQYALAVMAYQLLTGRVPFQGNMQQVMYKHLQERPLPPSTFNSRIPPSVDWVILKALEKNPQNRFSSIQAFATALEQAWHSERTPVSPLQAVIPPDTPVPPPPPVNPVPFPQTNYGTPDRSPIAPPPPLPPPPKKSGIPPWLAVVLGLIALVVIGGLAVALFYHPSSGSSSSGGALPVPPTPTATPTPTLPRLKSSYSGTDHSTTGSSGNLKLIVNSQDQQGNISVTVIYPSVTESCKGKVTTDNQIFLHCTYSFGNSDFHGQIFPDGHIAGREQDNNDSSAYDWNVS